MKTSKEILLTDTKMAKNYKEGFLEELTMSLPYIVCESKDFGRHFIATRDIKPLELILYDNPGVVIPTSQKVFGCIDCLKEVKNDFRCSGCMLPICGSDGCQNNANKHDKLPAQKLWHTAEECQMIAKAGLGSSNAMSIDINVVYDCIFIFRMMSLKYKDAALYDKLDQLMDKSTSHIDVNSNSYKTALKVQEIIDKFDFSITSYSEDSITITNTLHYLGLKNVNGYDLSTVESLQGAALYPAYSLLNSHCYCNTRCTIDPNNLAIELLPRELSKKAKK